MTRDDAGFTLVEAVIAGTLCLCLALPAYALLRRTYGVADLMWSRFRINAQARQAFSVLGDGGAPDQSSGTNARGFYTIEGLRSRSAVPVGSTLRNASQLVLPDGLLTLSGDTLPSMAIACSGPQTPVPDCAGTGTVTVSGWIGRDPAVGLTPAGGRNAAVSLAITDPNRAVRARLAPQSATETYRTIYTLNAEATP